MKFSALFTALIVTWAVASPLAWPEVAGPEVDAHELSARVKHHHRPHHKPRPGVSDTPRVSTHESLAYQSVKKAMPGVAVGRWYKIFSKSPYTPPGPNETPSEIQKLKERLGYNHIAVVVGVVTERTVRTGKGKYMRTVIWRDFESRILELRKEVDGRATLDVNKFLPSKVYVLDEGARSSPGAADKAVLKAQAYFKQPGHAMYNLETNNCDTFARYLYAKI